MKYYIIAGEPSGDLHAANLMSELLQLDSKADFRFWGGELMQKVGGTMYKHYRETAFMGVFEVLANIRKIKQNFKECKQDIKSYQPDVVILVDYPGFNLRIAEYAFKNNFRTFYYITPKIWAWNTKRVHKIRKYVNELFTILPFETKFYQKFGVEVNYIGNPIMDAIENTLDKNDEREDFIKRNDLVNKPVIGMLAGSRKQELQRILPDMLTMIQHFPNHQFVIAGAPSFTIKDYEPFIEGTNVKVLFNETYPILTFSDAAMVTSGTATLEAGILNCPQVVCYKMWGGGFTDFFAKKVFMNVKHISLVNLILEKESVVELFQSTFSLKALKDELSLLVYDDDRRRQIFTDYEELRIRTGKPGSSKRAAELMIKYLS